MMKLIFLFVFSLLMVGYYSMFSFYSLLCFLGAWLLLFNFKFNMSSDTMIFYDYLMLDKNSYSLVLLTLWVLGLMFMSLGGGMSDNFKSVTFIIMLFVLIMFFCSSNLMIMYLFFELSLIPTYLIIVYWGANPERTSAAFYLLIYMLLISLPLLFYIYYAMISYGTLSFLMFDCEYFCWAGWWDYIIIIGAFLIKLPIYIFHVWLPKAHVEAPVYGSMILAAVLLKLGGYGLYRMLVCLKFSIHYHSLVMSVGLIGGLLVSFLSMIQVDMKMLVAYSSVVHMNLMLAALLTTLSLGWSSVLMIMVSHGMCSSGLFYMVNLYYERSSSRLLLLNKGMISYIPVASMWWFLLCASNFSYPLSLNFFGEITMLMALLSWNLNLIVIMIFACFFSGAYSLYLFSYVHHGSYSYVLEGGGLTFKEISVIIFHYFPLLLILLNLFIFY